MLISFDPNTWYCLKNAYLGTSTALDVVNDDGDNSSGAIQMAAEGNCSGQLWQLRPHLDRDGTYSLCTLFLGVQMHLDVFGNDKTKLRLAKAGNFSGQKWMIVPWASEGEWDRTFKLMNEFSGVELSMDGSFNGAQMSMRAGDRRGQHWTITPIRLITEPQFLMGWVSTPW